MTAVLWGTWSRSTAERPSWESIKKTLYSPSVGEQQISDFYYSLQLPCQGPKCHPMEMKSSINIQRLSIGKDILHTSADPHLGTSEVLHLLFCCVTENTVCKTLAMPLLLAVFYAGAFKVSNMLHLQSMQHKAEGTLEYKILHRSNSS